MSKKKPKIYSKENLLFAIEKWPDPIYDKKHGYYISYESLKDRDFECDLTVEDLMSIPEGINNYFLYKKDKRYKNTFNYYLSREDAKGFIKVSVNVLDDSKAKIKTIYIAYRIK